METGLGWSVTMPLPSPLHEWRHMPKWMQNVLTGIDWKETGALVGVLGSIAVIVWKIVRPFWERIVQRAMQPWITYIKRNVRLLRRLRRDVDKLEEKVDGIERTLAMNTTLDRLYDTVDFLRERERVGREERRREGSPLMQGGRRKDDPPPRER